MQMLPALPALGLILISAPGALLRELTTALTVQLALSDVVRVLDGGNHFDGLKLTRELRRQTRAYRAALGRVSVARAFTCYQMETLLANTHPGRMPTLVMETLTTFYDENIVLPERRRLLGQCLVQMKQLSRLAPIFVSAQPADDPLFEALDQNAQHHWRFEVPEPAVQLRLF